MPDPKITAALASAFPQYSAPVSPLQAGQAARQGVAAGIPQLGFMRPTLAKPNKTNIQPPGLENQMDVFSGNNLQNVLAALRK